LGLVVYKPVEGDGAREILAKYKARVVEQTSSGIADARNLGLYGANTEFVAFIDDDCTAEPDWLMRLVEGMVAPNIGCVGGSAYGPDGVQFSGGWVDAYGRYKVVCSPPATGGGARFVNIVGMSCMFRRSDAVHV
jgi:cellulose synthase/poly-beta-1,6-N-acetylglucosamine synthase-like glycosyltransferase